MTTRNHIGVIIQARMTSTRLPGKVLMKIDGISVLEIMLKRVSQCQQIHQIIVATTVNQQDDAIVELCDSLGVSVFRGDEHDVLARYYQAAIAYRLDNIVRLTSDCPMIDPEVCDQVIKQYKSSNYDYVSNCDKRSFPDGLDTEVFTFKALKTAHEQAQSAVLREGVTPYIRANYPELESGNFNKGHFVFAADFSHIRWTLDTKKDFDLITTLITNLPRDYRWLDALSFVTKQPHLLA